MTLDTWWNELSLLFERTYCMDIAEVYDERFGREAYEHGENPQEVCDWLGEKYDLTKKEDWTVDDAIDLIGDHLGSRDAAQTIADALKK